MIKPLPTKFRWGILGGAGMLGSDLVRFLGRRGTADAIDRENYTAMRGKSYDVLVNANGNSKRFWANEHPREDFEASTASVYRTLIDFKFKKYVYISSSDVYEDHADPERTREAQIIEPERLSPYSLHKFLSELVVRNRAEDFLILRSSMILGTALRKGPLFDILAKTPLFVTKDSRLQMVSTEAIAGAILALSAHGISREIFNVGGVGAVSFERIQELVTVPIRIDPSAKKQEYEMDVSKLQKIFPLRASGEYLKDFLIRHHVYAGNT